jgi:diguanylate cyclase (GGDEF)-like protein
MGEERRFGWQAAEMNGTQTTSSDEEPGWALRNIVEKEPSATPVAGLTAPPAPFGWTDGLTDSEGPRFWDRVVAVEQARNARHKRTGTIVLFEVVGFEDTVQRWGTTLALQLFVELSRVLSRGNRESDHLARIAPTRFAVLLTETDEIRAINYVDRIKEACQRELDPATNGLRVVVGWASPEVGRTLAEAYSVAESRLGDALRREALEHQA